MHAKMAAICVILSGEQLLLMKQQASSFAAGRWSVIGGRAESGETPDRTVRREVLEESGLTVNPRHAGHVLLYETGSEHATSLSLFVATDCAGDLRSSEEGEPVWVPLAQVDRLDLVGYLRLMLPHLLAPHSFLTGTIQIGPHGEARHWSLDHHTVAATARLEGEGSPAVLDDKITISRKAERP